MKVGVVLLLFPCDAVPFLAFQYSLAPEMSVFYSLASSAIDSGDQLELLDVEDRLESLRTNGACHLGPPNRSSKLPY